MNKAYKKRGFSLVEVLIAAGLLGVIALGGMRIIDFQTKRSKDTSKNLQIDSLMFDLAVVLRDRESCYETFKSFNNDGREIVTIFKKTSTTRDSYLTSSPIGNKNEYGAINGVSGIGKVKILKMALGNQERVGSTNLYKQNLIITFEKLLKKRKGTATDPDKNSTIATINRILPIKFVRETGATSTLKRCVSTQSNNLEDLCSSLGGLLDTFDNDLCKGLELKRLTNINAAAMGVGQRPYALKADGGVDVHGKMRFIYKTSTDPVAGPPTGLVTLDDGVLSGLTKLQVQGDVEAAGVTAFVYNHISDRRAKKNISTISSKEANKILKLRGVKFKWKEGGSKSIGLVAQEVQKQYPELVGKSRYGLSVQYANLIGPMLEVIKRQDKEIRQTDIELKKIQDKLDKFKKNGSKK